MLRVLEVHSGNLYGGIETFHTTFARAARSEGIDVEFAMCFEGRPADELRGAGALVHSLGNVRLRAPRTVLRARRALADTLARGRYDVAVVNSVWTMALFAGTVRRTGTPLVAHLHDAAGTKLNWLERLAARHQPDLVVANSEFTARTVERLFPRAPRAIVRYCVAPREPPPNARLETRRALGIDDDTVVILQVSRMEPWKGHELHIAALSRLRTEKKWVCLFAGGAQRPVEAKYVAQLRDQAARAGISDRVRHLGQRSDVPSLLAAADVFCQPNASPEPFGIVFIEALGTGLPVVTTNMGGPAEFVDETCGVLTPPGDAAAIASALTKLIDDADLRRSFASAARKRADEVANPAARVRDLRDAFASAKR